MRNVFTVFLLAVILAMCVPSAHAQPPVDGTWKTQLGDFLEGRYSIAWPGPNSYGDAGNILHAESWNGAALGGQWRIICPVVIDTTQLYYVPFSGGAYIAGYEIMYSGGTVWLDGAGPWGGGDPSYVGIIDTYIEIRGVQAGLGGLITGIDSSHNLSAHIVGYLGDCVAFAIGNTAWIGDTPQHGAKPAGYPDYLDGSCNPGGTGGHWGTATDLTLVVAGCEVSTEDSSWGQIKARYR